MTNQRRASLLPPAELGWLRLGLAARAHGSCQTMQCTDQAHGAGYIAEVYADMRAVEQAEKQPHSYTTARTLLSILRIAQALARLRFSSSVDKVWQAKWKAGLVTGQSLDDAHVRPQACAELQGAASASLANFWPTLHVSGA